MILYDTIAGASDNFNGITNAIKEHRDSVNKLPKDHKKRDSSLRAWISKSERK